MKRINAQWVFLIILALWIPVLCFADETVGPEQETVVEETIVVSDNFGPPYEPEESSLIFTIWAWGVVGVGVVGGIFGICSAAMLLFYSFKLNYHLYIEHGEFAFWFSSSETQDIKERRRNIIKTHFKNYSDPEDADMLGWWCCWLFMALGTILIAGGAILWPILLVGFAPFFIVRAVAFNKRRKKVFQDKLKGNETNGIV